MHNSLIVYNHEIFKHLKLITMVKKNRKLDQNLLYNLI